MIRAVTNRQKNGCHKARATEQLRHPDDLSDAICIMYVYGCVCVYICIYIYM